MILSSLGGVGAKMLAPNPLVQRKPDPTCRALVHTSYRMRSIVPARRRPTRRVDPGVQLDRSLLLQRRKYQREEHGQAHEDGRQHDLRRAKLGFDLL